MYFEIEFAIVIHDLHNAFAQIAESHFLRYEHGLGRYQVAQVVSREMRAMWQYHDLVFLGLQLDFGRDASITHTVARYHCATIFVEQLVGLGLAQYFEVVESVVVNFVVQWIVHVLRCVDLALLE